LVQVELGSEMSAYYGPRSRGRGPGGWLFASEVDIHFDRRNILRPDLAGWRRERMQSMPGEVPVVTRPDWVCEISSASNRQNDLFRKFRVYQRCGVYHYWIIDPDLWSLTVYRWTEAGYLVAQTAQGDESLRAEPFPAVELYIPEFFMEEPATGPGLLGSHRDAHPG
jgi:Uma2 family endonuclease